MELQSLITRKDSKLVFKILREAGGDNRFIGGCVRNALLNLEIKDIDISTTLLPDKIENAFASLKNVKTIDVGKEYGTVMVVINAHTYEITTLRQDITTDGRYPVVEYTKDWKEDAKRRDFTINAMSYDPERNQLYDYFGGQEDLRAGIIRFVLVPEERVKEDYLRILRLFRFYTYYGKSIDYESLMACTKYANKLLAISKERKMNELFRIMEHGDYLKTLQLMLDKGILHYMPPDNMNWAASLQMCARVQRLSTELGYKLALPLKIFALIGGGGVLNTKRVLENLAVLPIHTKKYLKELLRMTKDSTLEALETHPYRFLHFFREVLADGFIYLAALPYQTRQSTDLKEKFDKLARLISKPIPKFPLNGKDIIGHFGIKQGMEIGTLLKAAKEVWFRSECTASKEELIASLKPLVTKE